MFYFTDNELIPLRIYDEISILVQNYSNSQITKSFYRSNICLKTKNEQTQSRLISL